MRTETDEIRDNLKYLTLLSRDYPSQAAAASEIISTQALLKLPKGTEHFMSDLHGEEYPRRAGNADLLPQRKAAPAQGTLYQRGSAGSVVHRNAAEAY